MTLPPQEGEPSAAEPISTELPLPLTDTGPSIVLSHTATCAALFAVSGPWIFAPVRTTIAPAETDSGPATVPLMHVMPAPTRRGPKTVPVTVCVQLTTTCAITGNVLGT